MERGLRYWPFQEDNYFIFTIYRDPIERFISGYKNRLPVPHVQEEIKQSGLPLPSNINEFAKYLEDYAISSMDIAHHFAPQICFFPNPKMRFCRYYNMNELQMLENDLSAHINRKIQFEHINQSSRKKEDEIELTDESIKKLKNIYRADENIIQMIKDHKISYTQDDESHSPSFREDLYLSFAENIFYKALKQHEQIEKTPKFIRNIFF